MLNRAVESRPHGKKQGRVSSQSYEMLEEDIGKTLRVVMKGLGSHCRAVNSDVLSDFFLSKIHLAAVLRINSKDQSKGKD